MKDLWLVVSREWMESLQLAQGLGWDDSELVPHFAGFHTLSRNSNAMVRTRLIWGPY
jgi:hypothetical protein